jgi:hypothetical protein
MHERMAQLGGRLEIDSSSAGTTVRATILLPDVVSTETLDPPSLRSGWRDKFKKGARRLVFGVEEFYGQEVWLGADLDDG